VAVVAVGAAALVLAAPVGSAEMEQQEEMEWRTNPGVWCSYCAARAVCPSLKGTAAGLSSLALNSKPDLAFPGITLGNLMESAERAQNYIDALRARCEALERETIEPDGMIILRQHARWNPQNWAAQVCNYIQDLRAAHLV